MLRLFLQLGYEMPVRRFASKILLLVAAMSLMMLYLYYTADLTATMTSESKSLNIKSLSDVEEQGYKVLTMPPGSVSIIYLQMLQVTQYFQDFVKTMYWRL